VRHVHERPYVYVNYFIIIAAMIGPVPRLVVLALLLASFCHGNCSIPLPCQLQCKEPCTVSIVRNLGELDPQASISPSSTLGPPAAATDQPAAHQTQDEPMSSVIKRVADVAESKALAATQVRSLCCARNSSVPACIVFHMACMPRHMPLPRRNCSTRISYSTNVCGANL
jgi:hypothetical protein